ncbi:MAG: hypothetical protein ACKVJE_00390 [Pseudomonadales bacterium]
MAYSGSSSATEKKALSFDIVSNSTIFDHQFDEAKRSKLSFFLKEEGGSETFDSPYEISSSTYTDTRNYADIRASAKKYSKDLIRLIKFDEYIEGEVSKTGLFLESLYKQNQAVFRDCFQKAWLELYTHKNPELIATFINIASTLDYEWLEDSADALILAAYNHKDTYVNDSTLRAIESWEQPKHLDYLEQMRPIGIDWLDDYKQSVLQYLRNL